MSKLKIVTKGFILFKTQNLLLKKDRFYIWESYTDEKVATLEIPRGKEYDNMSNQLRHIYFKVVHEADDNILVNDPHINDSFSPDRRVLTYGLDVYCKLLSKEILSGSLTITVLYEDMKEVFTCTKDECRLQLYNFQLSDDILLT